TVAGFYHLVSRGQYEAIWPVESLSMFAKQAGAYWKVAMLQFGWLYLPFVLAPLCVIHRLRSPMRRWLAGLVVAFVCLAFLMLAILNPSPDRQSLELHAVFFTLSYLVLALAFGYGLAI